MANRQRGEVELVLGEAAYTLRPTFTAIDRIEQRLGKSLVAVATAFYANTLPLRERVVIVEECIRATEVKPPADLGEQIMAAGFNSPANLKAVMDVLSFALTGKTAEDMAQAGNGDAAPTS